MFRHTELKNIENYLDAVIVDIDNIDIELSKQLLFSLKPGGYIITINNKIKYHRNTITLEDSGFEIRDQIIWFFNDDNESLCLARKPLSEKTIVDNVIKWGTGGINIDGCRISHNEPIRIMKAQEGGNKVYQQAGRREETTELKEEGRFPANILFDETAAKLLDEQSGISKSNCKSGITEGKDANVFNDGEIKKTGHKNKIIVGDYSDKGGASRFFFNSKTKDDRRPQELIDYLTKLITPENGIVLLYK